MENNPNAFKGNIASQNQSKPENQSSANQAVDVGDQPPASPFVDPKAKQKTQPIKEKKKKEPPQNAFTSAPIVGPHSLSGGRGFKTFVIIGTIVVLAIWGGVGYLYMKNQKSKINNQNNDVNTEISEEVTPTPEFTHDQIKIKNGNVIWEKPNGETVVIVDKENYESTGITGFLRVLVSPDDQKICFESWAPSPEPALYISDVDGTNVIKVSTNRQNCLWASDSSAVFYINTSTKSAPVNVFKYDLKSTSETDLTSASVPSGIVRRFEIIGLSADGSKLICKYENLGGAATTETMSECEINLETGEVNSL